mmetsp:Transcript_28215/g.67236  ORF Transcript_28215/g.67236 Transcript_28215/m.67236 type:complete len:408 (+) Transcript_28215:194-1417(+)
MRIFYDSSKLIIGPAPHVGVLDLPGSLKRPPVRLLFPARPPSEGRRVHRAGYFIDNRVAYILLGFMHIALARSTTKTFRFVIRPIVWFFSIFFPARFFRIPHTTLLKIKGRTSVDYAHPSTFSEEKKQELIVFSHGLTGSGDEHSILGAALAKQGYIVAIVHHRDGSSSRVPMPDGTCKYYEHLPNGDDYDPKHRLEQVHRRTKEFLFTCDWLLGDECCDDDEAVRPVIEQIRKGIDREQIHAAGFSYGAATASLASALQPRKFKSAIFLDGWFHIDFSSRGIEFDFPPESFGNAWPRYPPVANAEELNEKSRESSAPNGLDIPSIFINSSQFESYSKLYRATKRLGSQVDGSEMHVIQDTGHQSFCDLPFWLPKKLGSKAFQLGSADAYKTYETTLCLIQNFLARQ